MTETSNAKRECELLLTKVMPFAEQMLTQFGEFHPYGAYMKPSGEIVNIGAYDGEEFRPGAELIELLREGLRSTARSGNCRATAVVFDVLVTPPGSARKGDAVQVCLEHVDDYCAEVFFPYQIENGKVVYSESFAQKGTRRIFGAE